MANQISCEPIPDSDQLFRRIHRIFYDPESGRISSGAFDGEDMSVNWDRYATPIVTASQDETGNTRAVVSLGAFLCRSLGQTVVHDPLPETGDAPANPAHSLVRGRKSKPVKQKLRDAAVPVWKSS